MKVTLSALLIVLGSVALNVSLCGGFFTVLYFTNGGSGPWYLPISVSSLVVGGIVAALCFRVTRARRSGRWDD